MLWLPVGPPAFDSWRVAREGAHDATVDAAAGLKRLMVGGYRNSRYRRAAAYARENYGLELVSTGCMLTPYRSNYDASYNQIALARLGGERADLTSERLFQAIDLSVERR